MSNTEITSSGTEQMRREQAYRMTIARLLDAIERYPADIPAAKQQADAVLRQAPLWTETEEVERTEQMSGLRVGQKVRERYVPAGCQPWRGTVLFVAPDGWVGVDLGVRSMSVPPHNVESDED